MNIAKNILTSIILCASLTACTQNVLESDIEQQGAQTSPLSRAVENPMSMPDFKRTYGVGFSFDGFYGELCNIRDIKCQVLDYQKIKEAANGSLIRTNRKNEIKMTSHIYYNRDEYYQNTLCKADLEAKLIIFDGKAEGNMSLNEKGERNDFFCEAEYACPSLQVALNSLSLKSLIQNRQQDKLLTPNFTEVLNWLHDHNDIATIDSFIERYGTHVVTSANLGGSITIHIHLTKDSLTDLYTKQALREAAIMKLFKTSSSSEEYKRITYMLNSADCKAKVRGGDLSKIPNETLSFTFGESPDLSKYIGGWAESLHYDQENFQNSNLEMIEMNVTPIWYFIPNDTISSLVRQRIFGTVSKQQKAKSFPNAVCTSFELPKSVTCKMGGTTHTFQLPQTVNVISGERYVATICRERIPAIDSTNDVQVVYPIIDRQANLMSGLCVHEGKTYRVSCLNGKMETEHLGNSPSSETIYLNNGVADTIKYENLDYQPSHLVMDYEWPYSIKPDGTLNKTKPYYWVYKKGTTFYLRTQDDKEQTGELEGLPNCILEGGRMVRAKDYHYYWNPLEIQYQ